jgi:hypothetical protein
MYCLFYVVLCIVCVYMCTVLLPPGDYLIAVNKYYILPANLNPCFATFSCFLQNDPFPGYGHKWQRNIYYRLWNLLDRILYNQPVSIQWEAHLEICAKCKPIQHEDWKLGGPWAYKITQNGREITEPQRTCHMLLHVYSASCTVYLSSWSAHTGSHGYCVEVRWFVGHSACEPLDLQFK